MREYSFEVFVIGTGTSAYHVVSSIAALGHSVGVADMREYGGTCALRGCQAKKFFVTHAETRSLVQSLNGRGFIKSSELKSDWNQIRDFKNSFTSTIPQNTEESFEKLGATLFHGQVTFLDSRTVQVGDAIIFSRYFVIATGSSPAPLTIPGHQHAIDSEAFLSMSQLPRSCAFIGGGYIAYEFAHILNSLGVEVSVVQRSQHMLKQFDLDLVSHLVESGNERGLKQYTMSTPTSIEKKDDCYVLTIAQKENHVTKSVTENQGTNLQERSLGDGLKSITADLIINAGGRVANTENLGLEKLGISVQRAGIEVDEYLRCMSGGDALDTVFAIGDVVKNSPQLATVADLHGAYVAALLERVLASKNRIPSSLYGDDIKPLDYPSIPSVVFTHPQLAKVGLTEQEARDKYGDALFIKTGSTASWPSSIRVGETHGWYKILYHNDELVGAHILRHEAGESINVFALAMEQGITRRQLMSTLWAYPTMTSDIKHMI